MLKLKFKNISTDTQETMKEAINSTQDYYSVTVDTIKNTFSSDESYVLNSANSCLLTIVQSLPEPVLVADQGGWNGFIKSCEIFEKKVCKIETDYGLINIDKLDQYFKENTVKSFYITSLAGYTAQQPLNEICDLCNTHDVVLIVDISGSIGDENLIKYGDIQVASTGSPKIVNIENGGIINKYTDRIKLNKHLLKTFKADKITCAGINNEIKKAVKIEEKTIKANTYLKNILKNELSKNSTYNIIHPEYYGLNTIITAESKKKAKILAYNIRQRIKINRNIITTGPSYNRMKTASINIEIKNLDISSLTKGNMNKLCAIIVEEIEKIEE